MAKDRVRVPDLWLKRALALALFPAGEDQGRIDGTNFATWILGPQGTAYSLNHLIAGDTLATVGTDLFSFAATIEYLLLHGVTDGLHHETIVNFARQRGDALRLWPKPVLGTYSVFANALLKVVAERSDWSPERDRSYRESMARVLRQQLHDRLLDVTAPAGKLRLLWGKTRNWALSAGQLERIIRQPAEEIPDVPAHDFIQLVVPPAPGPQLVFGYELRMDDEALTAPWEQVGGWFVPRHQPAHQAIPLLAEYPTDEQNPTAENPGLYWIYAVAMDLARGANEPPQLPADLLGLTTDAPKDWPQGYANAIALVTYVDRIQRERKRRMGKMERAARNLEPNEQSDARVPVLARLYLAEYRVK